MVETLVIEVSGDRGELRAQQDLANPFRLAEGLSDLEVEAALAVWRLPLRQQLAVAGDSTGLRRAVCGAHLGAGCP